MKKSIALFTAAFAVVSAFAEDEVARVPTPVQISFASPLQLPPFQRDVWGLRANILFGLSGDVYGLDAGLIGAADGDFGGVSAQGFNLAGGSAGGIQLGAVGNYVGKNFYGLQAGGILNIDVLAAYGVQFGAVNIDREFTGLRLGLVDYSHDIFDGWQFAAVNVNMADTIGASWSAINYARGNLTGAQIGLFNSIGGSASGFQLGVFNAAADLTGVQIGVLNLNVASSLPIMAVLNARF